MRWLIALLLVALPACGAAPPAPAAGSTPTTGAAAAPKPSPPQASAPATAPATPATTPTTAAVAAPKPGTANPTAPAAAVPGSTGAAPAASTAPAPGASPTVAFARGTVTLTRTDGQTRQLQVEIADDDASRARGLMFRPSMPEDAGMIFLFPQETDGAFWMQNTLIPLSIAFVAADGRILEILDMQPQTTEFNRPAQRYRSALEVNQGYFARHGIRAGDRVELRR